MTTQTTAERAGKKEREARTRAAIEAYVAAWRSGDRAALLDVFAADATWEDPVGTPPWTGRARIGEFWDQAHAGGSTLTPQVERIVVCGSEGMLVFRMIVRTPEGGGMGIDVCDLMQVNDAGKIQVARAYWDGGCVVPLSEC
jgi:steroid delta-isomerase